MKTVVVQAYAGRAEPVWVSKCRDTVKEWAIKNSFDYVFHGDEFFDYAPEWVRNRLHYTMRAHNVLPVVDMARLHALRYIVRRGHRAIWIDADVVVMDQDNFILPEADFITVDAVLVPAIKGHSYREGVTNSIMGFLPGSSYLDKYIYEAEQRVLRVTNPLTIDPMMLGPKLLEPFFMNNPTLRLLGGVGCFEPVYLEAFLNAAQSLPSESDETYLSEYRRHVGRHITAANLCHSHRLNIRLREEERDHDAFMNSVVKALTTPAHFEHVNRVAADA